MYRPLMVDSDGKKHVKNVGNIFGQEFLLNENMSRYDFVILETDNSISKFVAGVDSPDDIFGIITETKDSGEYGNVVYEGILEYPLNTNNNDTVGDKYYIDTDGVINKTNANIELYKQLNNNQIMFEKKDAWHEQTSSGSILGLPTSFTNSVIDNTVGQNVGKYASIAINPNDDTIWVSYLEDVGDDLKFSYYDGVSWGNVVLDATGDPTLHTSIAINPNDNTVWISYNSGTTLKVARYDGSGDPLTISNWGITTVYDGTTHGNVDWNTSIKVNTNNDEVYISYYTFKLYIAYYDGSWHDLPLDTVSANIGYQSSLDINLNNNDIWIVYRDFTNAKTKIARYVSGSGGVGNIGNWTLSDLDTNALSGTNNSIAVNQNTNYVYVSSYYNAPNSDLVLYTFNGTTWSGPEVIYDGGGLYSSIAIDSNDRIFISHKSATLSELYLEYYDGTSWTHYLLDDTTSCGEYTAIAINPNNFYTYVVNYDLTATNLRLSQNTGYFVSGSYNIKYKKNDGELSIKGEVIGNPEIKLPATHTPNETLQSVISSYKNNNIWEYKDIDIIENPENRTISMDINRNDNSIWVTHFDNVSDILKVSKYNGKTWTQYDIISIPGNIATNVKIKINQNNNSIWIAYENNATGYLTVSHSVNSGASWTTDVVDSTVALSSNPNIGIDINLNDDYVWVSYAITNILKVAYYNGTSWTPSTIASGSTRENPDLAINQNDNSVWIPFWNGTLGELHVAVWDGLSWNITVVDDVSANTGWFPSIDINQNNNEVWISYKDQSLPYNFKYAVYDGSWTIGTIQSSINIGAPSRLKINQSDGNVWVIHASTSSAKTWVSYYENGAWDTYEIFDSYKEDVFLDINFDFKDVYTLTRTSTSVELGINKNTPEGVLYVNPQGYISFNDGFYSVDLNINISS